MFGWFFRDSSRSHDNDAQEEFVVSPTSNLRAARVDKDDCYHGEDDDQNNDNGCTTTTTRGDGGGGSSSSEVEIGDVSSGGNSNNNDDNECVGNNNHHHRNNLLNNINRIDDDDDDVDDDGTTTINRHHHISTSSSSSSSTPSLGLFPLVAIIFYNVSGGPFGLEEAIRSGGPFYTLLGFIVFPFVWSLQESCVTAELCCAFPDAAAGVAWVEEAFGQTAGFMVGYLSWVSGATDNAIYPVLFLDYLLQTVNSVATTTTEDDDDFGSSSSGAILGPWYRFLLLSSTTMGLAYVNWLGLELVGTMSLAVCVLAMSPFLVLTCVGVFKVEPSRWFELPSPLTRDDLEDNDDIDIGGGFFSNAVWGGVLLRPFLNNLFWNLNSYDSAAAYSEEIAHADRPKIFPKAIFWSVFVVSLGYIIPLLVLLGVPLSSSSPDDDDNSSNGVAATRGWEDGYIAVATAQIVGGNSGIIGPWMGVWTVFAAGISNLGLFQAELSSDAYQLMGMANRGHVPRILAHKSRHGTPTYAIVLGALVIIAMSASDLDKLIEMLNFNYGIALLMEYAAFLKLRISKPHGTKGCMLFLLPTIGMTLVILLLASYETYVVCTCANLVGYLLYTRSSFASPFSLYRYYQQIVPDPPVESEEEAQ